jgi:hypothetical protein
MTTYRDDLPPCQHDPAKDRCGFCKRWAADPGFRGRVTGLNAVAREARTNGVPPRPPDPAAPPPEYGPGAELEAITSRVGLSSCVGCRGWVAWMNQIGPAGCRLPENRDLILDRLRRQWAKVGRARRAAAVVRAGLATTLPFRVNWSDPFPDVLNLAISRAETKERRRGA